VTVSLAAKRTDGAQNFCFAYTDDATFQNKAYFWSGK
jgi:hypothetical protein